MVGHGGAEFERFAGLREGGVPSQEFVFSWVRDGVAPDGRSGRKFNAKSIRAVDLLHTTPKSVGLTRAFGTQRQAEQVRHAVFRANQSSFRHLGAHGAFNRAHNAQTGKKDLLAFLFFVGFSYLHDSTRRGDPSTHLHSIVSCRVPRATVDRKLVSYDLQTMTYEARAASMVFQAQLRSELTQSLGVRWNPVDPKTGHADIEGFEQTTIDAWSIRSHEMKAWAEQRYGKEASEIHLRQMEIAKRETRPAKPESLDLDEMRESWRSDPRAAGIDIAAITNLRIPEFSVSQRPTAQVVLDYLQSTKKVFNRSDIVEVTASLWPYNDPDLDGLYNNIQNVAVEAIERSFSLSQGRASHNRPGHTRYTTQSHIGLTKSILHQAGKADPVLSAAPSVKPDAATGKDQLPAHVLSMPFGTVPVVLDTGQDVESFEKSVQAQCKKLGVPCLRTAKPSELLAALKSPKTRPGAVALLSGAQNLTDVRLNRLLTEAHAKNVKLVWSTSAADPNRSASFNTLVQELPWSITDQESWARTTERAATMPERLLSLDPRQAQDAADWYADQGLARRGSLKSMTAHAVASMEDDHGNGKDSVVVTDQEDIAQEVNTRVQESVNRRFAALGVPRPAIAARGSRQKFHLGDIVLPNDPDDPGHRWIVSAVEAASLVCQREDDTGSVIERRVPRDELGSLSLGYAVALQNAGQARADRSHALLVASKTTRHTLGDALARGTGHNDVCLIDSFSNRSQSATGSRASELLQHIALGPTRARGLMSLVEANAGAASGRSAAPDQQTGANQALNDLDTWRRRLRSERMSRFEAWRASILDQGHTAPRTTNLTAKQQEHLDAALRRAAKSKQPPTDTDRGLKR